jgi:chemotaxis protein CheC
MLVQLSDFEQDAILEIFNIGVGAASATLSEMVGEEVRLSLPDLKLVSREELVRHPVNRAVSAIHQSFDAPFGPGRAVLTFPEEKSLTLVTALMGEETSDEELSDMQEEALTEVGNIILNACLGRLSDMVRKEIEVGVPRFQRAESFGDLLMENEGDEGILWLSVQFTLADRAVDGRLFFLLEVARLRPFIGVVEASFMGA